MKYLWIIAALTLMACQEDETISGYLDRSLEFKLVELDGRAFAAQATIQFPAQGEVIGQGPCNSFAGGNTAPLPWFNLGPVRSTRMACPELKAEQRYFAALAEMTQIETLGATVILRNEAGREMVFQAAQP